MRLYLIRHGRPQVASGICYGSTDVHVESQETARIAATLKERLPQRAPVYSSPLRRCSELAALLRPGVVTHDARLAEMHFGEWEMRAWDDIPPEQVDAWASDLLMYRPGGGESVLEVAQRVHAFHAELKARQIEQAIVVCHAGTIRLLSHWDPSSITMARNAAGRRHDIGYGELRILDC